MIEYIITFAVGALTMLVISRYGMGWLTKAEVAAKVELVKAEIALKSSASTEASKLGAEIKSKF